MTYTYIQIDWLFVRIINVIIQGSSLTNKVNFTKFTLDIINL